MKCVLLRCVQATRACVRVRDNRRALCSVCRNCLFRNLARLSFQNTASLQNLSSSCLRNIVLFAFGLVKSSTFKEPHKSEHELEPKHEQSGRNVTLGEYFYKAPMKILIPKKDKVSNWTVQYRPVKVN